MKLRTYFIVGAICAILFIVLIAMAQEPKTGNGLIFKGHPVVMAIPSGHPDFTRYGISRGIRLTNKVWLLLIVPDDRPGQYMLIACEYAPMVIALSHVISGVGSYWIYETNLKIVDSTKEEFERMKVEAQYLCVGVKSEEV